MFKNGPRGALSRGTEEHLLEAAGEIFAEQGYRAATIRQICEKAGVNIAAVNYHFGDKDGLYRAVLRFVHQQAKKYPPKLGLSGRNTPEQRLGAYIRSLLYRIFDEGRPGWHMKLMMREMTEPTRAFDVLVKEGARPLHLELASIVREFLGPKASDEVVRLCTLSILGQGLYYRRAQPVINRLYPQQKYGPKDIEKLVKHITQFSVLALRNLSKRMKAESR